MYLSFQRGITAMPIALGSMLISFLCNPFTRLTAQKNQLDTSKIDTNNLTRSKEHVRKLHPTPLHPDVLLRQQGIQDDR
jgi:hypothetical protein